MSAFAKRFCSDRDLEENGVWIDLGDDIQIKVARTRSRGATAALARLNRPYENMRLSGRALPEAVKEKIARQWVAEAVLLDWKGVTDADGKALAYSVEAALKVLEAFPDFLDEVVYFANQQESFRAEALEAAKGNSPTPSAGS